MWPNPYDFKVITKFLRTLCDILRFDRKRFKTMRIQYASCAGGINKNIFRCNCLKFKRSEKFRNKMLYSNNVTE